MLQKQAGEKETQPPHNKHAQKGLKTKQTPQQNQLCDIALQVKRDLASWEKWPVVTDIKYNMV